MSFPYLRSFTPLAALGGGFALILTIVQQQLLPSGIFNFAMSGVFIVGVFAILALSLNFEYGFTGLVNFGKAGFFMIGGWSYGLIAVLTRPLLPPSLPGLHMLIGFLGGMTIAAVAGLLVSLPSLRLREDYLAILTLVFTEILRVSFKNWEFRLPSGETIVFQAIGLRNIPRIVPFQQLGEYDLSLILNALFAFSIFVIFYALLERALNAPFGRTIRAIREDELAAKTVGKNTFRYKALVFTLSSAMAGAAGGLWGQFLQFLSSDQFAPVTTFQIWIMAVLGGIANTRGALLGAGVVVSLNHVLLLVKDRFGGIPGLAFLDPINLQWIFFGLLLILIVMFRPEGLLREPKIRAA